MSDQLKVVGQVHVDSAQILILDPGRLTETQYASVIRAPRADGAAEVWLENEEDEVTVENFIEPPRRTNDGVVVDIGLDGSFSVRVEYRDDGIASAVRIDLG